MNNLNRVAQTILLITGVSFLLGSIINPVLLVWVALLQFVIGCWQILDGVVFFIAWRNNDAYSKKILKIYWVIVIVYFIGLIIGLRNMFDFKDIIVGTWFFSAWIIAVYYYLATQKFVKIKSQRKTYLDIAN